MKFDYIKFFIFFLLVLILFCPKMVFARIPNDPNALQWAYNDIGVYKAWDKVIGSSDVIVAVIDNGIDMLHPDLADNMWVNSDEIVNNGIDDDNNGYIDDYWGWNFADNNNDPRPVADDLSDSDLKENILSHGTLVAGLVGSVGDNGLEGLGINWRVKIMNVKVLGNQGQGDSFPLYKAIEYAVFNGANVINISMVSDSDENLAELKEIVKKAYERGVVIVAAAGNNMMSLNEYNMYPICLDEGLSEQHVLGVSAIGENHRLARFSNSGASCVDITAPGVNISSTIRFSPINGLEKRYASGFSGTSFATPLVSGTAALLKSIQPNWGPKEVYEAILSTTHHTPSLDEAGYAELFGKGLLQVDKAVDYAISKLVSKRVLTDFSLIQFVPKNGKYFEKHYNLNGIFSEQFTTSSKAFKINLVNKLSGDFDLDGQDEAVIMENPKEPNKIKVFDHDGRWMFDFYAFEKVLKNVKVQMLAGDYNQDNKDELIVFTPGQYLEVWSLFPLRKLEEFNLGFKATDKVRLLGF